MIHRAETIILLNEEKKKKQSDYMFRTKRNCMENLFSSLYSNRVKIYNTHTKEKLSKKKTYEFTNRQSNEAVC